MKKYLLVAAVGLAILAAFLFIPLPKGYKVSETAALAFKPFGGMITSIIYCSCSAGAQLLIVGPPRGGNFLYQPGLTRLYAFGSIKIGSWVLGIASLVEQACLVYAGTGCVNSGSGKPIIMMGTSK